MATNSFLQNPSYVLLRIITLMNDIDTRCFPARLAPYYGYKEFRLVIPFFDLGQRICDVKWRNLP